MRAICHPAVLFVYFYAFIFELAVNISVTGWLVANARLLVSTNQIPANV